MIGYRNNGRLRVGILGAIMLMLCAACGNRMPGETVEIHSVGDLVLEQFDLDGFDEIEVSAFFDIEITHGSEYSVAVEVERALLPYLRVEVRGGILQIGLQEGILYNFENASQRAEVTLPELARVSVANHSTAQLNAIATNEPLDLEALDFSTVGGSIQVGKLHIDVLNHSSLTLTGSAAQVTGEVLDFSSADVSEMNSEQIDIEVDGNSSLER